MSLNQSSFVTIWKEIAIALVIFLISLPKIDAQKMDSTFFKKVINMNHRSDSLQLYADQLLSYDGSDSLYKNACLKMGTHLHKSKKYKYRVAFTTQLLEREELNKDLNFYSKSHGSLGGTYYYLKKDSLCFLTLSKGVKGFRDLKDTVSLIKLYANISTIHSVLGNYRAALDTLKSVEPILYKCPAAMKKSGFYFMNALATSYSQINDLETAIYYKKKAIALSKIYSENWASCMYSLTLWYSTINQDTSNYYLNRLLSFEDLHKYPQFYTKTNLSKINMLAKAKQTKEAERLLLHLIEYGKENNHEIEPHIISHKKALIAEAKKEFIEAANHYQTVYEGLQLNPQGHGLDYTNGILSGYLESKLAIAKDTTAIKYLNILNNNNVQLRENIVENQLEDFKVQFNTREKERENEFLLSQKQLLEKNNTLQRALLLGATLLLGLISFMGYRLSKRNKKQKQLNIQLTAQRDQIKILNRELNHRVKNNLSFMTSLLEMQGRRTDNTETKQILRESESRLKALSIVHNNLFQNDTQTTINLKDYLIEITTHLQNIFEIPGKTLQVETDLADIDFDAEDAMRVGLVVNELVTNSVKHAFSDVEHPKIVLETVQESDGKIVLRYKDNGPGFVQKELRLASIGSESIGMKLIELLERQLVGKLDLRVG